MRVMFLVRLFDVVKGRVVFEGGECESRVFVEGYENPEDLVEDEGVLV